MKCCHELANDHSPLDSIDAPTLHRHTSVTTVHDDWKAIQQRYATWKQAVSAMTGVKPASSHAINIVSQVVALLTMKAWGCTKFQLSGWSHRACKVV